MPLRSHGNALSAVTATLFASALVAALFFNGVNVEFLAVAFLVLTVLALVLLWQGYSRGLRLPRSGVALTVGLFLAWLALTLLWSRTPYISTANFWWLGGGAVVFWLLALMPDRTWRWIAPGIFAVGVAVALFSLYQLLVLKADPSGTFFTHNSNAALLALIVLPASGYFLIAKAGWPSSAWRAVLGAALFAIYLAIAVSGGRGVALGLWSGFAVIMWFSHRHTTRRRLLALFILVAAAHLVANLLSGGLVVDRLASLANPAKAGYDRFLIWQQAWQMLMDNPWWGIGLGAYWLHWPPYRHPDDVSGGFYVHNDYLQIWIEAGLPGLLLWLAIYATVLVLFARAMRRGQAAPAARIEMAGLFAGLLAIAVHTFFDFDLYILPIQLVLGAVLARLHALCFSQDSASGGYFLWQPSRHAGRVPYRVLASLVVLPPLLYFSALGSSVYLADRARDLPAKGQWAEASRMLDFAMRLMPDSDFALLTYADVLRQALVTLPAAAAAERRTLYEQAMELLDRAVRANPLRPQAFYMRGVLYQNYPEFAGDGGQEKAATAFAAALRLDPLAYWARQAYAGILMRQGRETEAEAVLEAGASHRYTSARAAGYLLSVAALRRRRGDHEGATAMRRRIEELFGDKVRVRVESQSRSPGRPR